MKADGIVKGRRDSGSRREIKYGVELAIVESPPHVVLITGVAFDERKPVVLGLERESVVQLKPMIARGIQTLAKQLSEPPVLQPDVIGIVQGI
jgi:hypothetical protein